MSSRQADILITGFGPFPGAPDNPSGRLVELLEARKSDAPEIAPSIAYGVLPTNWQNVETALDKLLQHHMPRFALHLGYADCSPGFRLETTAYNETCRDPDVCGQTGTGEAIKEGMPSVLETSLFVEKTISKLKASDMNAEQSTDPGRYLCNKLYYLSLAKSLPALFIHIPAIQFDDKRIPETHEGEHSLGLDEAIRGIEIVMKEILQN